MIERQTALEDLRRIVGRRHVLTRPTHVRSFATGYRFGAGPVLAVVRPGSLVEQWRVLQACVAADLIIIVQAANTGLTGGSTPYGEYDRPVVIISTTRMSGIYPIRDGRQVVCLSLRRYVARPRAPTVTAGTRAAFCDRLVVHRSVGDRWRLQ